MNNADSSDRCTGMSTCVYVESFLRSFHITTILKLLTYSEFVQNPCFIYSEALFTLFVQTLNICVNDKIKRKT